MKTNVLCKEHLFRKHKPEIKAYKYPARFMDVRLQNLSDTFKDQWQVCLD